jgi:hypothetical protein
MDNMDRTPADHLNGVLQDFGVDLALVTNDNHDSGDEAAQVAVTSSYLGKILAATKPADGVPADMIIVSRPPGSLVAADVQLQANARTAQALGVTLYDGYSPFKDLGTMSALGWDVDGTHPADEAWTYLGNLFWRDFAPHLGFSLPMVTSLISSNMLLTGSNGASICRFDGGDYNLDCELTLQNLLRAFIVRKSDDSVAFSTKIGTNPAYIEGPLIIEYGGTAPATSTSAGPVGTIMFTGGTMYICRANNTWVRIGASGLETSW